VETEEWNAEKITNEFARKVFTRELADKCEPARLRALYKKFNSISDVDDKILTIHNFHSSVSDKYSGKKERGTKMIKDSAIEDYYFLFRRAFYRSKNGNYKTLLSVKKLLSKDTTTLSALIDKSLFENADSDILLFLLNCKEDNVKREEVKTHILKRVTDKVVCELDFNQIPLDLKDSLFNQIELQKSANDFLPRTAA